MRQQLDEEGGREGGVAGKAAGGGDAWAWRLRMASEKGREGCDECARQRPRQCVLANGPLCAHATRPRPCLEPLCPFATAPSPQVEDKVIKVVAAHWGRPACRGARHLTDAFTPLHSPSRPFFLSLPSTHCAIQNHFARCVLLLRSLPMLVLMLVVRARTLPAWSCLPCCKL